MTEADDRFERQMRSVLGGDIYEALSGRGHTATQIASMTPEQRFDEYCAWHLGDRRWGEDLRATWKRCSFDAADERLESLERLERQLTACSDTYEAPSGKIMMRVWATDLARVVKLAPPGRLRYGPSEA